MKLLESPWAVFILALGFITMIEVMHINAHESCRGDCPCSLTEEY